MRYVAKAVRVLSMTSRTGCRPPIHKQAPPRTLSAIYPRYSAARSLSSTSVRRACKLAMLAGAFAQSCAEQ